MAAPPSTDTPTPLIHGHSHNDYEHKRPLFDALDRGYCSVEADIWLVNGKLLVAHDLDQVKPERTLEALYLDPLRARIKKKEGTVYPGNKEFTLLIELKSSAEVTYPALRNVLQKYTELLTEFRPDGLTHRAITVIVTGNSPLKQMEHEKLRLSAADGGLEYLEKPVSPLLVPLVSDSWLSHFKWIGIGDFPDSERQLLRDYVLKAHKAGYRLRFWETPESPIAWHELRAAGVDLVGVDDLERGKIFLLEDMKR